MTASVRRARAAHGRIITVAFAIACSSVGKSQTPIAPTTTVMPDGWLTYSEPAHAFSISYPAGFVVLPDPSPPVPRLVKRVRFQDRQIASSPLADRGTRAISHRSISMDATDVARDMAPSGREAAT